MHRRNVMTKLIVFDLDNTLAECGKGIAETDIAVLKQLEENGIRIAICSGKPVNYLCGFMRQVGLKQPILLGENGAVIQIGVDLPPKQHAILPYSKLAKETICFVKDKIDEKLSDMWYQPNLVGLTPFPKSEDEFELIANLLEEYKTNLKDVEIYRHIDSFDIVPVGINKKEGLRYLGNLLEITSEETIAVGDGVNDYPMFEYAKVAVGINVKDEDRVDKNVSCISEALEYLCKICL